MTEMLLFGTSPLRRLVHRAEFRWWMSRFLRDIDSGVVDNDLLRKLIKAWRNPWSAEVEYARECIDQALQSKGAILECGSGLSSLLVGAAARVAGKSLVALEHHPFWLKNMLEQVSYYHLENVAIVEAPLKDYGNFSWYGPAETAIPSDIGMVICDGPPGDTTRGGRYGLMPLLTTQLSKGCLILLDDASRPGEQAVLTRWQAEFGTAHEIRGQLKPFARVIVG